MTVTSRPGEDQVSGTPTAVPPPTAQQSALDRAREALTSGDEVVIAVLGDSTSNTRSEWVHLWARGLAQDRPVQIIHWNEAVGY